MSSKKEPDVPGKGGKGVSRRGFIRGVGIGGGALGTGILEQDALAKPQAGGKTAGPDAVPITLKINGKTQNLTVEPRVTLVDALRNRLDLTGAKKVCDRGTCGACTVIMNGKAVYGCSVLAIDAQGKDIRTIEGMGDPARMHPVSAAFFDNDAQQCGYCTPGFVVAATNYLERHPHPKSEEEVQAALGGNLCRCGTYFGVRKAVLEAAGKVKGGRNA